MEYLSKLGTIFLFVAYFTSNIQGQDVCVKKKACSCVFPNGTGIDLSPTNKTTFFTATNFAVKMAGKQYELSTYFYHPCVDMVPKFDVNSTNANDTCNKPLALCRHVTTLASTTVADDYHKDGPGIYSYLGSETDATFSTNGSSIIYNNKPSETIVLLTCAETDDQLHIDSLADPENLVLKFYSRSACLKTIETPDEGRSFGSTLLIIFFSLVIFYLVLGVCTKKFLMGATGIEVIPNLGFWTDLPNLVKDGWAFSINGFKLPARGPGPVTSPDPNSYDSI